MLYLLTIMQVLFTYLRKVIQINVTDINGMIIL
jgi:hypothetical protein